MSSAIKVFFPGPMANVQVSYICASLSQSMARHLRVQIHAAALVRGYTNPLVTPAVHPWLTRWGYRHTHTRLGLQARLEEQFKQSIQRDDVAWLWPGRVVPMARWLKERGIKIVAEVINCHQATARRILEEGYQRAGLTAKHGLTDARIADENEFYRLADGVFSPSPMVTASLLENGVPQSKIIETSYGWAPELMPPDEDRDYSATDNFRILTVGTVCVRKGQHLLAKAWNAAGVKGELAMVGWMGHDFAGRDAACLSGEGIRLIGPVKPLEVGPWMRKADVFVLATLEEGSPLVTYEAAALGLPVLTTPMGAGGIIRDGIEGIVIDPYDHDGWVQSLRKLASDPALRSRLGRAARERAREFTWQTVADQRVNSLCAMGLLNTP